MYGVPRFNKDKDITLKIQANGWFFLITAESEKFFPEGVDSITNAQIIESILRIVNYPKEEVNNIVVEKDIELLGDDKFKTNVCYGKIRDSQYDPSRGPGPTQDDLKKALNDFEAGKITKNDLENLQLQNIPTWWNHMVFWISKGRIYICTHMVNSKQMSSASTSTPYYFKLE